ncbi:DUF4335 domain-containing protein [Phormidium tenue FACHB-886]|nr:DUF4335 domain-containing protein [Phormidium tenue FACHB-886]
MAIQRQYSLPNCKLILEGIGDTTEARPLVAAVSNVECYFSGHEKPLTGGREFLESLVAAVSDYAQEFLSGIIHPAAHRDRQNHPRLVQLERVDRNLHRLMVQPSDGVASPAPQQLDLTTVQLFDLVEAIDQFYADAQTLPEMALSLSPLPKRYVTSQEPISKRAAAPALGVSGLAIAAAALFFVPAPQVQRSEATSGSTNQTESQTSPSATASASPPGSSPAGSPTGTTASPTASPTDPAATADEQAAGAILNSSPEITDPAEQERLLGVLQEKVNQAWTTTPTFTQDLEYRVGVASNGDIVGYSFANDEALQYKQEVPLANLLRVPTAAGTAGATNPEPIAQYRVVFKPTGGLEISPWYGQAESSPAPAASPSP